MKNWDDLKKEHVAAAMRATDREGIHPSDPKFLRKYEQHLLTMCAEAAKREGIEIPGASTPAGLAMFNLALRDVRQSDANFAVEYAKELAEAQATERPRPLRLVQSTTTPASRTAATVARPAARPTSPTVDDLRRRLAQIEAPRSSSPAKPVGSTFVDAVRTLRDFGTNKTDPKRYQAAYETFRQNVPKSMSPQTKGGNLVYSLWSAVLHARLGNRSAEQVREAADAVLAALAVSEGPEAA